MDIPEQSEPPLGRSIPEQSAFLQGGTAMPFLPADRCYPPSLTDKSQPSIPQKARNTPKRNTVHHPVSLNGKYSKAARLSNLIWKILGGLL
ncbi:MAG: hypothetical protein HWD63_14015 [Candidatus Parvibacillus calidus]|nr:MAG: hypothetical protein HWD63_14015 [Candidatus Parvibacillus calidus]